jgi:ParB-like chromosome segregation protein Spo0J
MELETITLGTEERPRRRAGRSAAASGKRGGSRQRAAKQNDSTGIVERPKLPLIGKNGEPKVILRKLLSLKPYPKNAMIHTPEQIEQVANSIKRFGWTIPILVDENDVILAGHARREASLKLGMELVPVIVKRGLTEDEKSAYRLADNKLARNADFDWQLIAGELQELRAAGFDLDLTGFRDFEYNLLMQADWMPPAPDETEGSGQHDLVHILVTHDQKEVIDRAMAKVRKESEDEEMKDGRALELICADYLAGP